MYSFFLVPPFYYKIDTAQDLNIFLHRVWVWQSFFIIESSFGIDLLKPWVRYFSDSSSSFLLPFHRVWKTWLWNRIETVSVLYQSSSWWSGILCYIFTSMKCKFSEIVLNILLRNFPLTLLDAFSLIFNSP